MNHGGKYPGEQIGMGTLESGFPAFFYLGSGISEKSKERYASFYLAQENAIRIKPVDPKEPFDQFRHYQAIRIDLDSGLLVVSNSQALVDPIFEHYKFASDDEKETEGFVSELLRVIGPEPDNKEKPISRIVGVYYKLNHGIPDKERMQAVLAITTRKGTAVEQKIDAEPGKITYVQTYDGNVDYKNFDATELLLGKTKIETNAIIADHLADEIFDASEYVDPQYGELRVWCIAGVKNRFGAGGWQLAWKNRKTRIESKKW